MKYNAEQVAFMLHEAIDENREYKSGHLTITDIFFLSEEYSSKLSSWYSKSFSFICINILLFIFRPLNI